MLPSLSWGSYLAESPRLEDEEKVPRDCAVSCGTVTQTGGVPAGPETNMRLVTGGVRGQGHRTCVKCAC